MSVVAVKIERDAVCIECDTHLTENTRKYHYGGSLFSWIDEETKLQKPSKVRSAEVLMLHCWGKPDGRLSVCSFSITDSLLIVR